MYAEFIEKTVSLSTANKIIIQHKLHQKFMFYQVYRTEVFTTVEQQAIRAGSGKCLLVAVVLPVDTSESGNSHH